jgi:chromosome partitioning protein
MRILGLLARKGGAGKTTLAIHLSVLAQEAGKRVLLIDLDPQHSAADWWRARTAETPLMVEASPDKLAGVLEAARADRIDLVVVDTRPSVEADAVHVAGLSDVILIPSRPAILDLRAILETLNVVKGMKKAHVILNACPAARGVGEASIVVDARKALKAFGVPVAPTVISQRAALSHALIGGLAVSEVDPDSKATKEMRALWRYVEKELRSDEAANPGRSARQEGAARSRARGAASAG